MDRLQRLRRWTFSVFDVMHQLNLDYQFCFSGGKDSHLLAALLFDWMSARKKKLNAKIVFSDTMLESPELYRLIDRMAEICRDRQVEFIRVKPDLDQTFWVTQWGIGYPVPHVFNRWCTKQLKIVPGRTIGGLFVTGSHLGESIERDTRLKGCGSTDCGLDMINANFEPLGQWTPCDVWDYLIMMGDRFLYNGVLEALQNMYDIADSQDSSLRMGCFMCPVISKKTLQQNCDRGTVPAIGLVVRDNLERLKNAPRLQRPNSNKQGAILVDARIASWKELRPHFSELIQRQLISQEVISRVEEKLIARSYPPTYPRHWIEAEERRLKELALLSV